MTDQPDGKRGFPRSMSSGEKTTLSALLQLQPETRHFIAGLDCLVVQEMTDGEMGSLLLIPKGAETAKRAFGKQIAAAEFKDSDGVPVSVTINTDGDSRLYELDVWKVNFAPLLQWPDASSIRIAEQRP